MKKYFYLDGTNKLGPFSFEELKIENLTRETKVWFYGLDNWTKLSEIHELESLSKSIPPSLKVNNFKKYEETNNPQQEYLKKKKTLHKTKKKNTIKIYLISGAILILSLIIYVEVKKNNEIKIYKEIVDSAFEADVDFDFYVDKFYRDIEIYGLFPKKPKTKIIKFAKFDHIDDATHYHGVSTGFDDDDLIEIYINPSTWEKFNKPMRYFLMYHELSHDVLNLDDLEDSKSNEGKLMYPVLTSYEMKTMDDFIESSHALFEEVSGNR